MLTTSTSSAGNHDDAPSPNQIQRLTTCWVVTLLNQADSNLPGTSIGIQGATHTAWNMAVGPEAQECVHHLPSIMGLAVAHPRAKGHDRFNRIVYSHERRPLLAGAQARGLRRPHRDRSQQRRGATQAAFPGIKNEPDLQPEGRRYTTPTISQGMQGVCAVVNLYRYIRN